MSAGNEDISIPAPGQRSGQMERSRSASIKGSVLSNTNAKKKVYSVKAEPFRANYYLMIILKRRHVHVNFCIKLHQFPVISK